jgi:hypothetical protein
MNTEEKVKIDVGERGQVCNPPVKFRRARNARPESNNFRVTPKLFSQLKDYFHSFAFDLSHKMLTMVLFETPQFDVFRWIEYVQQQNHEAKKSPFFDLDNLSLTLTLLDCEGKEVGVMKFAHLCLEKHCCELINKEDAPYVQHQISISYGSVEVSLPKVEIKGDSISSNELTDHEWQVIETP